MLTELSNEPLIIWAIYGGCALALIFIVRHICIVSNRPMNTASISARTMAFLYSKWLRIRDLSETCRTFCRKLKDPKNDQVIGRFCLKMKYESTRRDFRLVAP